MRVLLTYADDQVRAGYTCVDPHPRSEGQTRGDVADLSWILDNGEAAEIVAYRVLERYQFRWVGGMVVHWASKLRPEGTLCVVGDDLYTLAEHVVDRNLTLEEANEALYGKGDDPRAKRASLSSARGVMDLMRGAGLTIVEARYEDDKYVVRGKRP